MASRLGKHLRAKSKAKNFGLFALYHCYFFVCCLTAPWLTFGYNSGNSPSPDVNHCIWAINFWSKGGLKELGFHMQLSAQWALITMV